LSSIPKDNPSNTYYTSRSTNDNIVNMSNNINNNANNFVNNNEVNQNQPKIQSYLYKNKNNAASKIFDYNNIIKNKQSLAMKKLKIVK
jgi:hypothetical protein